MKECNKSSVTQIGIKSSGDVIAGSKYEIRNEIKMYFGSLDKIASILQDFQKHDIDYYDNNYIDAALKYESILHEYESLISNKNLISDMELKKIGNLIELAAISINELKFGEAHDFLSKAINLISEKNKHKLNKVYKEYFLTGFIYYSSINDTKRLLSFINNPDSILDLENQKIVIDALQEQDSRKLSLDSLKTTLKTIESIYNYFPDESKPIIANSLGLAHRRIGERGEIEELDKAISIFSNAINLVKSFSYGKDSNNFIEIELLNNKGISLIRKYEISRLEKYLDDAESDLEKSFYILEHIENEDIDPRYYTIKPNVYNNLGNLWKQKAKIHLNLIYSTKAIYFYDQSEKYWSRDNFPYFWSIVQKNKSEVYIDRFTHFKNHDDLKSGLFFALESIDMRDYENSPFQWTKSAELVFKSISLLQNKYNFDAPTTQRILSVYICAEKNRSSLKLNNFEYILELFNLTKDYFKRSEIEQPIFGSI